VDLKAIDEDIDARVLSEEAVYDGKLVGQILIVTIEKAEDVRLGCGDTSVPRCADAVVLRLNEH
jgi:hypothetical protein